MTKIDILCLSITLVVVVVWSVYWTYWFKRLEKIETRVSNQEQLNKTRQELYSNLADPEKIAAELERGANLREMRDAGRKIIPRDDAGPPAKVHRPLRRGINTEASWRREPPNTPRR